MHEYDADYLRKHVTVRFSGTLSYPQVVRYVEDIVLETSFGPGWRTLVDLAGIEDVQAGLADIHALSNVTDTLRERFSDVRLAICAPRDDVFEVAKAYARLKGYAGAGISVGVFRDRQAAEEWLSAGAESTDAAPRL